MCTWSDKTWLHAIPRSGSFTTAAMLTQRYPLSQAGKYTYSSVLVLNDSFRGIATARLVMRAMSGQEHQRLYELFGVPARPEMSIRQGLGCIN